MLWNLKVFFILFSIFFGFVDEFGGNVANAQICPELFRSTPQLEAIYATAKTAQPTEIQLLRAVKADVLGINGFSTQARYSLRRIFSIFELEIARADDARTEFHARRYEAELKALDVDIGTKSFLQIKRNPDYLRTAFSLGANSVANFLSYSHFGIYLGVVHIPGVIQFFDAKKIPDSVLIELINASVNDETPKTRAYVASKIRFGVDAVVTAARRTFNFGILASLLVAHGNLITDPSGVMNQNISVATSEIRQLTLTKNTETLMLLRNKRATFVAQGDTKKMAEADELIFELENKMTTKNLEKK